MTAWLRGILAIVGGFAAWFVVATLGNFVIRWLVPGYSEVERAMQFSTDMLVARLASGAVASLASGAACIAIARRARLPLYLFALLVLAFFIPIHVVLWSKFPVWYHLVFLGTLVPLVILGARLPGVRAGSS